MLGFGSLFFFFFFALAEKIFVMVGPHFVLHFLTLFLDGSLMALKCSLKVQFHITPSHITDVMQLHLV